MDTPSAFHEFLQRVRHELPELAPVIDHQLELWEGEIFTTFILDALSSAVLAHQQRVLDGTSTPHDRALVKQWLALGEWAMSDPNLAELFLHTAGDDLRFGERARALETELGPELRAALEKRWA